MPNSGKPELGGRGSAPPSRRRSYSISSTSNTAAGRKALPLLKQNPRLLHRAFVVEAVLVVLDELLVLLVGQIVDPLLRAGNADRVVLLQRQRQFVDRESGIERDLLLDAGLRILVEELHAGSARIEHEDRLRLRVARLAEF